MYFIIYSMSFVNDVGISNIAKPDLLFLLRNIVNASQKYIEDLKIYFFVVLFF